MGDDLGFGSHSSITKRQSLSPSSPEFTYVAKHRKTDLVILWAVVLTLGLIENLSSSSSYTWIVDLSGDGGNPSFNLDRGQEFNFLLVQNGRDAAGLAGDSIWSEWFTITNTASASSSSTPLSTASTSSTTTLATSSSTTSTSTSKNMASALKGLGKGARIGMTLSLLAAIFGIGA